VVVVVAVVVSLVGCATAPPAPAPSVYRQLGGREGIALIVSDFVANVVADARINERFKGLKPPEVERLKSNLSDQICDATGGPCAYVGRDMKTVEWNATVEALVKALDKNNVPAGAKTALLGALGPMKPDIVGQ
jgi:hemoglobin